MGTLNTIIMFLFNQYYYKGLTKVDVNLCSCNFGKHLSIKLLPQIVILTTQKVN